MIENNMKFFCTHLDYDKANGKFRWRTGSRKGNYAATQHGKGYWYIIFTKERFGVRKHIAEHRLVWFFENGSWPENEIDNIDHDKSNNRYENLRDVDRATNNKNTPLRKKNLCGVQGLQFISGKWRTKIY